MTLTDKKKEMLFILGQFLLETDKKFAEAPLQVSISKAEFIEIIKDMKAVSKTERTIYKDLEELQEKRYIIYDERDLRMSKKGYNEYIGIIEEADRLKQLAESIKASNIRFKRKIQTKLK
jgi:hypothetical protein